MYKITRGDKTERRQFCTKGQFCTRVKKKKKKKLKDKMILKKKSYWPRVRVRGNSDSKNKNKRITNKNCKKICVNKNKLIKNNKKATDRG